MASSDNTFTGCAQDYLDWFKIDEPKRIVIPDSQTDGEGLPALEDDDKLPPIPDYLRHDLGQAYAEEFQLKLVDEYEAQRKAELSMKAFKKESIDNIEEDTITGTLHEDEEDQLRQKTQVYLHYDFSKDKRNTALPVFNHRKEILDTIANHQVIVIEGETGCGKSTQVPQFILDDAAAQHKHCNIVVTQPRKIAATSLARRVCLERDWKLGKLVGYQVGLDNCTDIDTRLSFVTTEVLVQKLIHKRSLDAYTHIILDEVHERDQHTDFAILVVKKLLHAVSRQVKVILMSATIDAIKFARYFSTPLMGHMIPAPIVSVGTATVHKIQIFYLEALSIICKERPGILPQLPTIRFEEPGISDDMFKLVNEMVKCFDIIERQEENIENNTEFAKKRGAALIFLPGLAEIERLMGIMEKEKARYQWHLYPLHSTITQEEQQRVFTTSLRGFRKIILSTNIAESSITVTDIKYVVDSCLTKILTCDTLTNYTSLKLAWASKASCKQRAGRSGRVSAGRVYRLVPNGFYEMLPDYSTPELCRTPLSHVVLKVKILDMGEPKSLLALALDPPNLADIHRTILTLKQMGALAMKSGGQIRSLDGDLTYLGRIISILPVDPHLAKLIVMGYIFGCLRETIIIAAGLSLKSLHARPFQDELNAFLSKVSWAYGSFSDCLALLNAYELWQNMQARGEFLRPGASHEREWAKRSYIQLGALKEVHKLVKELEGRLEKVKVKCFTGQNPPRSDQCLMLKLCMAGAFFPHYYKRSVSDDYEKEMNRELSGHDPFTTVIVSGLPSETNILYDEQIRYLFKECSQNLRISYEGSKAYIQFPRTRGPTSKEEHFQDIPGECPTAMHLALKMRQIPRIQQSLVLKLYSQDESRTKMAELLSGSVKKGSDAGGKPFPPLPNRVRATDSTESSLKPPVLPSPANHVWRVHVTHIETAGHIWAISNETHALGDLNYIQSCIANAISREKAPFLDPDDIKPGQICLAPYRDIEGVSIFFRARIDQVISGKSDVMKTLVYFVDYGNMEVVKASELRAVPRSVIGHHMLAVECMLAEIKPASKSTTAVWDERATMWMKRNVLNKDFIAQIYSVVHGVVRVKLLNIDMVGYESINNRLICMGFAVSAEEFYLSKQNHDLRAIYSREFDDFGEEFSTISSSCSTFSVKSRNLHYSHGRVRLRGPESPLLMRFVALTRAGQTKGVKIEQTSVNSTALDLEPQGQYDRLLVSSWVSLNPSEIDVTLRNTTLMPSLPGIMTKCLLLFSPVAELRVSNDGTRYTGALVGLGADPASGNAIYPDDDSEFCFDVEFLQDDLILVNKIRFYMNVIIDEGEEITDNRLIDIQKRLRQLMFTLLDTKRESQEEEAYLKAYRWNMIQPEDILCSDTEGAFNNPGALVFPLHNAVILRSDCTNDQLRQDLEELKKMEKRLTLQGTLTVEAIDAECTLCEMFLKTFGNLQSHLASNAHFQKELKLLK